MPTSTYDLLGSTVLGSSSASVTISSLSGSYRDFICVASGSASANTYVGLRINNNSSSIYNMRFLEGNPVGPLTNFFSAGDYFSQNNVDWGSGVQSNSIFQLIDATATDKFKLCLMRANSGTRGLSFMAGHAALTAAVTSVTFLTQSGTFNAGTRFDVYGVLA